MPCRALPLASLLLFASSVCFARSTLTVETISNPSGIRISIDPKSSAGWSALQVVDAKTGVTLKTVHAGRFSATEAFAVVTSEALPAGPYKLRYREGVEPVLVGEVKRPDPKVRAWMNPTDLVLVGPWVYVLDGGVEVADKVPALAEERILKQPYIFKMDRDGKLDPSFADGGRLALPGLYRFRSFAVDPVSGKLFVGTGSHAIRVYEADGKPTQQLIGGWDSNPAGPVCLAWCNSLALGWKDRIYIPLPGYGNGKTYDRTKEGFAGVVYQWKITDVNGTQRTLCSDMHGSVYYAGMSQRITRMVDDGKSLLPEYQSKLDAKLCHPTGGSASAGLTWWACHGPGFGPFWDSGGGGEVVCFWDNGKELKLLGRYGVPGTRGDEMEFINPSAAIMDATHSELWVVEDGQANDEGPKGNARVRRFALKARYSETVDFSLPK